MNDIVIVSIDFETNADALIAQARSFAEKLGSTLLLVHVYRPTPIVYPEVPLEILAGISEDLENLARTRLTDAGKRANAATELRIGDPAHEILRVIEEKKPRLVVMGTHGRRGMRRLVLGSVAEEVIRQSGVPVLTIRSDGKTG